MGRINLPFRSERNTFADESPARVRGDKDEIGKFLENLKAKIKYVVRTENRKVSYVHDR